MAPLPHAAMEHPGHAQVLVLSMGRTGSHATRADWTVAVSYTHLTLPTTPYV